MHARAIVMSEKSGVAVPSPVRLSAWLLVPSPPSTSPIVSCDLAAHYTQICVQARRRIDKASALFRGSNLFLDLRLLGQGGSG